MSRIQLFAKLVLVCLSASALAETHFCIGGDLDNLKPTEVAACKTKMTQIREAVKRHGAPSGWHFVVVCDEAGWKDYASFVGQQKARLMNSSFSTDTEEHLTVVRGSRLDADSPQEAEMVLEAAMDVVPATEAAPRLIPNQKRSASQPQLEMAQAGPSDTDETSGQ